MLPSKSCTITFEGKQYEGKFPNNKGLLRIQELKSVALKGYGEVMDSQTSDGLYAILLCDMFAHFTVIFPDFLEQLPSKDLRELDALSGAKLVKVYTEQFSPWWRDWREVLQNGGVEVVKKEETLAEATAAPNESKKPQISA